VAFYNLANISAMVVEDTAFMRLMLVQVLEALGFQRVLSFAGADKAIEHLKGITASPYRNRMQGVDLIISDLVMAPIDGLMLLRWVRRHKQSPDRFVPFVMLSGLADVDEVAQARDLGVSEFMAKPFSVQSMGERLMAVIDAPRQFVKTEEYFGPDRRRQRFYPETGDRRVNKDEGKSKAEYTTTVNGKSVSFLRPANRLKERVGGNAISTGTLPLEAMQKALSTLDKAVEDYADWARKSVQEMALAFAEAHSNAKPRRVGLKRINEISHELRGQGGTFGYPLVSDFAKSLYYYTVSGAREDDNALGIVRAHIDALRAVINGKIEGRGGRVGEELLTVLQMAIDKFSANWTEEERIVLRRKTAVAGAAKTPAPQP
jgi:CheY-like chemotaxis protein